MKHKKPLIAAFAGLALVASGCTGGNIAAGTAVDIASTAQPGTPEHIAYCEQRGQKGAVLEVASRAADVGIAALGLFTGVAAAFTLGQVKNSVGESLDTATTAAQNQNCEYVWEAQKAAARAKQEPPTTAATGSTE